MDKGSLFRLALSKLGSTAQLVEGSPEFKALEDCAQQAVALALDFNMWDFAQKRVSLPVVDGWAALPGDCIELREVGARTWRKVGRDIEVHGNTASVNVVYKSREISDAMALPDHEPVWCEAVVCLVAAAIAGRVTGNANIGMQLQQMGLGLLYRAKLKEARSVSSNDQQPAFARASACQGPKSNLTTKGGVR